MNKIDHSIVNDAELIQKLEEQLNVKKRSRSRSRGNKDLDPASTQSSKKHVVQFDDKDFS
jgi:hypothetical protein